MENWNFFLLFFIGEKRKILAAIVHQEAIDNALHI